jgi:hypothetical protein
MKDKKELIRVVRDAEGKVFIDKSGKANGRGAYVCADEQCIAKCAKTKALNRAYKQPVDEQYYKALLEEYAKK